MGKPLTIFSGLTALFVLNSFSIVTSGENKKPIYDFPDLDIETVNWLIRVDSAGGSVSDIIIDAVDDYVKEVKGLKYQTVSIRNLLLRENWFTGDFNSAFVPLFRSSELSSEILGTLTDINHNYQNSEFTDTGLTSGLAGNGSSTFLETGFNPSDVNEIGLNDAHFMIFNMSGTVDNGRMGCRTAGNGFYIYPEYIDGKTYFRVNGTADINVTLPSTKGYILVQRNSPQNVIAYSNNNYTDIVTSNSSSKPNTGFTIGAFNNGGTIGNFTSIRTGGYSLGKSFTAAQQQIHFNAVQRLMSRLGRISEDDNSIDFKSKLFTFTGSNLVINYETPQDGYIKFEIQDTSGSAVNNFSLEDCPEISGNSFSHNVYWNSGNDLSSLVNIPVYLRIKMSKANLYSIQFQNPIEITDSSVTGFKAGTYKQFFADTLLFSNNLPAYRKMHLPVKNPEPVLSPTEPWEGNLLITTYSNIAYSMSILSDQMVYKMWLRVTGSLPAYYESADGINWTRPNLESYKFDGSMENNIISDAQYPAGHYTVIDDSLYNKGDSSMRYKSVYNYHTNHSNSRLNVSFSNDGVMWIPYSGNPVRNIGEDLSSCGWNPVLEKYLGYFRDSLNIRKVGRYISDDWINWSYTGTVLKPDAIDPPVTNFYNMVVLFKDSVYWGFAGHLQLNAAGSENPYNPSRTDNTVFIELLFSRDGINFVRCGNRQPFINYGDLGNWDDQMVYTVGVPVIRENEFYFYYNGFNFKHMSDPPDPYGNVPKKSHIGLAKIGLDRMISLTAY